MKHVIAATVLSCLLITKADAALPLQLESEFALSAANTDTIAFAQDPIQSLSSVGFAIEVPPKEDQEEGENSPVLPVDTTEEDTEDVEDEQDEQDEQEEQDEDDTEDIFPDESEELNNTTLSSNSDMAAAFAAAGLTYDENVDLHVFAQRKPLKGEEIRPVPQVRSCRSQGQVAITYSEGPSNTTARIARQLNNVQARASFFVNALMLKDQPYGVVLQNIYNAGHLIGMTYRLPTEDPETMSDEDIKADIIDSAHSIESLIHVAPKYVRLHFSARNDGRTEHILRDLGFVLVGYNLDGKDYIHKTPELIEEEYRHTFTQYQQANNKKKGSFVSIQYDIPETASMAAVPNIINLLQDEGYTAVRMDGCLNDTKPYKVSAGGLGYVGDKFSYGAPGYKSGQRVAASIIRDTTAAAEEIRGLTADDAFLYSSNGALTVSKLGYIVVPALVYAFSVIM